MHPLFSVPPFLQTKLLTLREVDHEQTERREADAGRNAGLHGVQLLYAPRGSPLESSDGDYQAHTLRVSVA